MHKQLSLAALALPLLLADVGAAPAPLPKPGDYVEVILDARTAKRAQAAVSFLRSRWIVEPVTNARPFREVLPHLDGGRRTAWLRDRLSASSDGTLVRVRLRNGPDALTALEALTAVLTGKGRQRRQDDEERGLILAFRMLEVELARGKGGREDAAGLRGWNEIESDPLKLHVSPRTVRRGR